MELSVTTGGIIGGQPVELSVDHRWNYRWTTGGIIGGPPVATAKAADATSVVHRWESGGSSVTTGELRLISNMGVQFLNEK